MLLALDAAAYVLLARADAEALRPVMDLPVGQAAYAAATRRIATGIALVDLPLVLVVGAASYGLAALSIRPLVAAREREERFAAEAAHEMRTPLARIAALAQSAREADAAQRADALEAIATHALRASELVSDLLALVRQEHVPPRLAEPVDVGLVATAAAAHVARDGVALRVDAPPGAYVLGDERRIARLASNFLDNAVRHARSAVDLRVAALGNDVILAVEDDGDGVPEPLRARIFDRFVRAHDDEAGTGLGLAICRAIAQAHGGDIRLEGHARFVARLPRFSDSSS